MVTGTGRGERRGETAVIEAGKGWRMGIAVVIGTGRDRKGREELGRGG